MTCGSSGIPSQEPSVSWTRNIERDNKATGQTTKATTKFTITDQQGKNKEYTITYEHFGAQLSDEEIKAKFQDNIDKIVVLSARYLTSDTAKITYTPSTGLLQKYDEKGELKPRKTNELKLIKDETALKTSLEKSATNVDKKFRDVADESKKSGKAIPQTMLVKLDTRYKATDLASLLQNKFNSTPQTRPSKTAPAASAPKITVTLTDPPEKINVTETPTGPPKRLTEEVRPNLNFQKANAQKLSEELTKDILKDAPESPPPAAASTEKISIEKTDGVKDDEVAEYSYQNSPEHMSILEEIPSNKDNDQQAPPPEKDDTLIEELLNDKPVNDAKSQPDAASAPKTSDAAKTETLPADVEPSIPPPPNDRTPENLRNYGKALYEHYGINADAARSNPDFADGKYKNDNELMAHYWYARHAAETKQNVEKLEYPLKELAEFDTSRSWAKYQEEDRSIIEAAWGLTSKDVAVYLHNLYQNQMAQVKEAAENKVHHIGNEEARNLLKENPHNGAWLVREEDGKKFINFLKEDPSGTLRMRKVEFPENGFPDPSDRCQGDALTPTPKNKPIPLKVEDRPNPNPSV